MTDINFYYSLLPNINLVKSKYSFLNLSDSDIKTIILKTYNNRKKIIEERMTNSDESKIVVLIFELYLKELLNKKETLINTLDSFINYKLQTPTNYEEALNNILLINKIFYNYNINIELDEIIELMKNKILSSTLELIYKRNKDDILNGNIKKIFKNKNTLMLVESYCLVNNIDIILEESKEEKKDSYNTDSIKFYLNEIGKYGQFTKEEEIEVFKKYQKGNYQLKETIIKKNLCLVVTIAKKYRNQKLEFLDLLQEGTTGLIKAIDKYDINKGYKFSTYAVWWIRQSMQRAIDDYGRNIRIPVHISEKIYMMNQVKLKLQSELKREPSLEEISEKLKMSIDYIKKLCAIYQDTISLNEQISDEQTSIELGDLIAKEEESVEDKVINELMQKEVKALINTCNLDEKELYVLNHRFGLNKTPMQTLDEIGKYMNLSKERIRQIENKALTKIRNSIYIDGFTSYMDNQEQSKKQLNEFKSEYIKRKYNVHTDSCEPLRGKVTSDEKTIYEELRGFNKLEINELIDSLDEEDKELLFAKYGEDLNKPKKSSTWDALNEHKFYYTLLPMMFRKLYDQKNEGLQRPNRLHALLKK